MSVESKRKSRETMVRLLLVALVFCALLAGLPNSNRFTSVHSRAATGPLPAPTRKQQYRVVNFMCRTNCGSSQEFDRWETTFVRDIIQALKFDTQNESRIGTLAIGLYDAKPQCQPKDDCDRITIDMDDRQLLLKCAAKQIMPVPAKRCDVPPSQRALCVKNMLITFAAAIREHNLTVHGGN